MNHAERYIAELKYLREVGRGFAERFPQIAGELGRTSDNPDIERLLEGLAFLTARVHERADAAHPELVHGLAEFLMPQLLRPLPAMTVVAFASAREVRGRVRVPRGAEIASSPPSGAVCRFRTIADLDLVPARISAARTDTAPTGPRLVLTLELAPKSREHVLAPEGLRAFIHAEHPSALALLQWITDPATEAHISAPGAPALHLGRGAARPVGLDEAALDWPEEAPKGLRLLEELFAIPEKFCFFHLTGLDAALPLGGDHIEIAFTNPKAPTLTFPVSADMFRLDAVVAVNLFTAAAVPIRHDPLLRDHLVRADGIDPEHHEVASIDQVTAIAPRGGARTRIDPLDARWSLPPAERPRFTTIRRARPLGDGTDTFLRIAGGAPAYERNVLALTLTCTNRALPAHIDVGELSAPTANSPSGLRWRNITRVTRPAAAPLGQDTLWILLGHLHAHLGAVLDAERLRTLLALHNRSRGADRLLAHAAERKVAGLLRLSQEPATRLMHRSALRGVRITLTWDEDSLECPAEAHLIGSVLHRLFADFAPLNTFIELVLELHPSRAQLSWPPRLGTGPLL
jgi:type VI secretion system protein ImpG